MTRAAANLELTLPDATGREICKAMESPQPDVPIIIVIWTSEVLSKVSAMDSGADDRVEDVLMSLERPATSIATYSFGECEIDFAKMTVNRAGRPVAITTLEFKLLTYFLKNAERVLSRHELLDEVWGYNCYPTTRTVDNQVLKLRQKVEPNPTEPRHLQTVYGAGYKFIP
jgi:DNA-binding response OmpR family regulator